MPEKTKLAYLRRKGALLGFYEAFPEYDEHNELAMLRLQDRQ